MPVTVSELATSRSRSKGGTASTTLKYVVEGTDDDAAVFTAVDAARPSTYDGLPWETTTIEPIDATAWKADVRYSAKANTAKASPGAAIPTPELPVFGFDTTGGTIHITQARENISNHVASGTAPNYKGAINVTNDGVAGVDIVHRVYSFTEQWMIAAGDVADLQSAAFSLTGKTNNATFRGLAAGECLFMGARGTRRADGDYEVEFQFAGSPNRTPDQIGDITFSTPIKGWNVLWVRYKSTVDAGRTVQVPESAHVERVYDEGDFSTLGIGTDPIV